MVLLPTFIVGVYGQNFDHMPELHWRLGYAFSWAVILVTTLLQFTYFRRRHWL
jgi:magnesium transporter